MSPLEKAQRIIALHGIIKSLSNRLAEIDIARADGVEISISFKVKNKSNPAWGASDGLKYQRSALSDSPGDLGDIAAIVLARLSDEVAQKKRQAEFELRSLEGASS